jgi:hypothetical protein
MRRRGCDKSQSSQTAVQKLKLKKIQGRQCTYNVTLRSVRATIVAVDEQ